MRKLLALGIGATLTFATLGTTVAATPPDNFRNDMLRRLEAREALIDEMATVPTSTPITLTTEAVLGEQVYPDPVERDLIKALRVVDGINKDMARLPGS